MLTSQDDYVKGHAMHATTIIAYALDGVLLCSDHGRPFDSEENESVHEDDSAHPLFSSESSEWSAIEWCDHGHSFCMSCGDTIEDKGSPYADLNGPFGRCSNCSTESVYVDGIGYDYAGSGIVRWAGGLETHSVDVYGIDIPGATDSNGYTRVTGLVDDSSTDPRELLALVAYRPADPSSVVLVLSTRHRDADECARDWFENESGLDVEDDGPAVTALRSSVIVIPVALDRITFGTRR